MNINLRPDESFTVIGMKGSGKTELIKKIIRGIRPKGRQRVVILDTKQTGDFKEYPTFSELADITKMTEKNGIVVYAPNDYEAKNPDYHEGFFGWCYARTKDLVSPTSVVVDELSSIVTGNDTPDSYKDITDRGRARLCQLIQGNQKPVFVPHGALSESDHFAVFDLLQKSAQDKIRGIILDYKRPHDRHGFWYYHRSLREPIYFPGLKL